MQKNLVKISHDGIFLIFFMHFCKFILVFYIKELLFFKGLSFVCYVVNGLNQCGYVLNVPGGHAFRSFYWYLSLAILWYVINTFTTKAGKQYHTSRIE